MKYQSSIINPIKLENVYQRKKILLKCIKYYKITFIRSSFHLLQSCLFFMLNIIKEKLQNRMQYTTRTDYISHAVTKKFAHFRLCFFSVEGMQTSIPISCPPSQKNENSMGFPLPENSGSGKIRQCRQLKEEFISDSFRYLKSSVSVTTSIICPARGHARRESSSKESSFHL